MRAIHLANEKKRDAMIAFDTPKSRNAVSMVMKDGSPKTSVKIIKTLHNSQQLKEQFKGDMQKLGEAIIAGDPEFDMELTGRMLKKTLRLWVTSENKIAYRVNMAEAIYNPDGTEKERRELAKKQANVRAEAPVRLTGKLISKAEAARKFVFARSYQLRHTSGLSYDFLYDMAKSLHESNSLMRLGAGAKGNEQICLSEGGEKYFGFLEGRVEGDKYCLILRLTNMELKAIPAGDKND